MKTPKLDENQQAFMDNLGQHHSSYLRAMELVYSEDSTKYNLPEFAIASRYLWEQTRIEMVRRALVRE